MSPEQKKGLDSNKALKAKDLQEGLIKYFLGINEKLTEDQAKRNASNTVSRLAAILKHSVDPACYGFVKEQYPTGKAKGAYVVGDQAIELITKAENLESLKSGLKKESGLKILKISDTQLEAIRTVLADMVKS